MNRALPDHPNLDHLKREAKSLLKSHSSAEANKCGILRHLHRFSDATNAEILSATVSLAEAQYALAMDYGFISWQALRQAVLKGEPNSAAEDYVEKILREALRSGASDLHFEPLKHAYLVRFKMDGMLRDIEEVSMELGSDSVLRLKELAAIDGSEIGKSLEGRFPFSLSKSKTIEFRVVSQPVVRGEKVSCRIVDPTVAKVALDQLGYDSAQLTLLKDSINQPKGLVLFAGPKGSGKTVCLYTALSQLDSAKLNISTSENPIEVHLDGIHQYAVNSEIGMDHASTLATILGTDPNVVMLSELPDLATAKLAIKSARKGNLLLVSLEANSALDCLTKLRELGISADDLVNSINLIVGQRLIRRLCTSCRVAVEITNKTLIEEGFSEAELAGPAEVFSPGVCNGCHDGYRGRIGLFEIIKVTGKVSEMVLSEADTAKIAEACELEGWPSIVQSGLKRVFDGTTSLEELKRVTGR